MPKFPPEGKKTPSSVELRSGAWPESPVQRGFIVRDGDGFVVIWEWSEHRHWRGFRLHQRPRNMPRHRAWVFPETGELIAPVSSKDMIIDTSQLVMTHERRPTAIGVLSASLLARVINTHQRNSVADHDEMTRRA